MTIFAVMLPLEQAVLVARIKEAYPQDHYEITPTQWLISATGTALEVVARLGIYDPAKPDTPATGLGIVFAMSSYHGRAPTPLWEWIKNKLEAKPNG